MSVGILNSDDYSSLNGGYYVVFSGDFPTKGEAEAELDGLKSYYRTRTSARSSSKPGPPALSRDTRVARQRMDVDLD